jgi:hypothetical protein
MEPCSVLTGQCVHPIWCLLTLMVCSSFIPQHEKGGKQGKLVVYNTICINSTCNDLTLSRRFRPGTLTGIRSRNHKTLDSIFLQRAEVIPGRQVEDLWVEVGGQDVGGINTIVGGGGIFEQRRGSWIVTDVGDPDSGSVRRCRWVSGRAGRPNRDQ